MGNSSRMLTLAGFTSDNAPLVPQYAGLRLTPAEYLALPEDGFLYDMIDGVLHVSPSANYEHNFSLIRFAHLLSKHLERHPGGEVVCETDVFLPDGGDVLRPDVCFISQDRLRIVRSHIHEAPDLVAELLSDRTAERDLGSKSERYLRCGVREYWLIDPRERGLRLRHAMDGRWAEVSGPALSSRVLAGLVIRASELFR